jgi:prepilin-type N-terminal cleavage/methylation domain-containing protein
LSFPHSNLEFPSSFEFRHSNFRGRRGFTLPELLIVLLIISLLTVLLLSALNRARETSRRAACLSNIRQLTSAWLMYANGDNGRLPASTGNP